MAQPIHTYTTLALVLVHLVFAQQQCYFGPGAKNRGPSNLVPCMNTGQSACCLLGDVCLSGNACWNFDTGNTYQYGCTDISYKDKTCPYKCGFNSTLSPWTALEYCVDDPGVNNTWVCHAPESCGCEWPSSTDMLILQPRQCKDMGSDARVALYAPSKLEPYVSLPTSVGGSTGYFSTTTKNGSSTWVETAISGYTPSKVTELTSYGPQPTQAVLINENAKPSASTNGVAVATTATATSTSGSAGQPSSNATSSTASEAGLSVTAKAGIGAGIGGGALVAAIVVLSVLLCRKRRKTNQPTQELQTQHPYHISAPMPASPYSTQAEKDSWNPAMFSAGSSPPMMSPHFDPNYPYPHIVPSLYSEQRSQKPPSISAPMELPAEQHVHELHSEQLSTGGEAPKAPDNQK